MSYVHGRRDLANLPRTRLANLLLDADADGLAAAVDADAALADEDANAEEADGQDSVACCDVERTDVQPSRNHVDLRRRQLTHVIRSNIRVHAFLLLCNRPG